MVSSSVFRKKSYYLQFNVIGVNALILSVYYAKQLSLPASFSYFSICRFEFTSNCSVLFFVSYIKGGGRFKKLSYIISRYQLIIHLKGPSRGLLFSLVLKPRILRGVGSGHTQFPAIIASIMRTKQYNMMSSVWAYRETFQLVNDQGSNMSQMYKMSQFSHALHVSDISNDNISRTLDSSNAYLKCLTWWIIINK